MNRSRFLVAGLFVALSVVGACGSGQKSDNARAQDQPAQVVPIPGSAVSRVSLTEEAASRIGLQTELVREISIAGVPTKAVPEAALLYDNGGQVWVYEVVGPLTFVRDAVSVERINGESAILSLGPPVGTSVVTVGAIELMGAETGIAGE